MKKIQRVEFLFEFLRVLIGIIIAFLICLVVIVLMVGPDGAVDAIKNFALGPLTSKRRIGGLIARYGPLMLTGCGMCFIYAAGRFSLIGEGIITLAPVFALQLMFSSSSFMTNLPQFVNLAIIVVVCAIVGGVLAMLPAFGREQLGANEMVTSTIMNYFCWYFALWILQRTVADRSASMLASPLYPDNMRFTQYWGNGSSAIWVAFAGVIVACVIFYRTRIGAKIRMCGSNLSFASYSGISATRSMYMGQLLGGLFAGVGAAVDCFGAYPQYQYNQWGTQVGMDGLIVAVMAKKQPAFVPLTALVLSYIRQSAQVLNTNTTIPIELVTMLQAVIVLFVAAENFLKGTKQRVIFGISRKEEEGLKETKSHA